MQIFNIFTAVGSAFNYTLRPTSIPTIWSFLESRLGESFRTAKLEFIARHIVSLSLEFQCLFTGSDYFYMVALSTKNKEGKCPRFDTCGSLLPLCCDKIKPIGIDETITLSKEISINFKLFIEYSSEKYTIIATTTIERFYNVTSFFLFFANSGSVVKLVANPNDEWDLVQRFEW